MPEIPEFDFESILRKLADHEVVFIVVGGIAAALEGVLGNTLDVDVVPSREPANVGRLMAALDSLGAVYRLRPDLKPNESHLASAGHKLLTTRFGPLDVLGTIGRGRGYDDLLPHAVEVELDDGLRVQALNLETLIAVKEEVAGEKDLAVLPTMRRTLEEKRRRQTS